ncbi:MAG: hypothetical protein GY758_03405, partial [Fuerstiella sp.]|nr:hypothetical protein [Fuerstiella sp.]
QIIQFQNAQIEALLKKPGKKRLLLDDDKRRLPVVKGHAIQPVETAAGRFETM